MSSRFARNMRVVLIACVAAGAMHWTVPYAEFDMLARGFLLPWLALAAGAGLIGRWISRPSVRATALLVGIGYAVAVFGRVAVEATFIDRTSHNLWPFEMLIGTAVGLIGGLAGALLTVSLKPRP